MYICVILYNMILKDIDENGLVEDDIETQIIEEQHAVNVREVKN